MTGEAVNDLGRSVIICQMVEYALGALVVIERQQRKFKRADVYSFLESFSKTRTQPLEAIRNQFADLKLPYVQDLRIGEFIDRRNRLVHRLVHNPRFLRVLNEFPEPFLREEYCYFMQYYGTLESFIRNRSHQIGLSLSEYPVSTFDEILSFNATLATRADRSKEKR